VLRRCVAALCAPSSAVIRTIPYTVLLTSVLAFLIVLAQQVIQGGNPIAGRLAVRSGLLCLAVAISIALFRLAQTWHIRSRSASSPLRRVIESAGNSIPSYFVLSVNLWLLLLLISFCYTVWVSDYARQSYFAYGFQDKRWIVYGYLVTIGSLFVLPPLFKRLTDACVNRPSTWRDFGRAFVATGALSSSRAQRESRHWSVGFAIHFAKSTLAVALAAIFFAPPWHVSLVMRPVDSHEMTHLGGLQAIDRGFLPYIGAASVHYGPGFQLLMYYYMKFTHEFTIIGFRESFAVTHWLAATIFMVMVFLRFRFLLATVIALVAVNLPPLTFFQLSGAGTLYGFYGWANGLRYLGALLVLLFLPTVLASGTGSRTVLAKGMGLGFIFALFCYMAQENLAAGILSGLIVLTVGWLTQRYTTQQLVSVVAGLSLGFAAFWAPVLGFYAYRGQLLSFLDLYFLANRLFANGYANSPFLGGLQDPWGKTYYFMPVLVVVLGGLALYRPRLSSIDTKWSAERSLIFAVAIFCLVAHTGAMFRADSTHVMNTMIGLGILIPCSVVYLPELIGLARAATRWSLRIGIVMMFVMLLPAGVWQQVDPYLRAVSAVRKSYWSQRSDAVAPQVESTAEAFRRVGASLIDEPQCCTGLSTSMKSMAELMVELKNLAGERPTYVENVSGLLPGHVYFFADLVPAPIYAERFDMIVNTGLLDKFLKYFKHDVASIQCVISDRLEFPELDIFKLAHPAYRVVQKEFEGRPLYIFLAEGER
jgi:hypothetical protein